MSQPEAEAGENGAIQDLGENDEAKAPSEGEGEMAQDGEQEHAEEEGGLQSLRDDLSKILVESPAAPEPVFDPDLFPPSYKDNNPKELRAIQICRTFIKQWIHLCHDRRPIYLKPKNEFGVQKLVCTTINPCQLPFKDLLDWQDIANFVADYLNYDPLVPPHKLPSTLYAPQTVLERQRGHCFDYSTLLCSMLVGSGYDAYVVSGYATREVCNVDLTYTRCPLVELDQVVYPKSMSQTICRYTVRPPRQFISEYLLRMHKKEEGIKKQALREKLNIEEAERKVREAPPPDKLYGWRVHSWVMVLAGLRDVTETFFIEPTTGVMHPTNWDQYLGVETLWNHFNYYLNIQQETISLTEPVTRYVPQRPMNKMPLRFDIGDSRDWEYVFAGQDLHVTKTTEELKEEKRELELKGDLCAEEKHFDLPLSWSLPLKLHRDDYDMRYPTGKKTIHYKYAVVEKFSHYLQPDGLIRKLYVYTDLACTDLYYTEEDFAHRADLLERRFFDRPKGILREYYAYGRDDFLREHHYHVATPSAHDGMHVMMFQRGNRVDELYKREQDGKCVKQYYGPRADRKHFKEVRYGPRGKVWESTAPSNARPIEMVIERFTRNPDVPANRDIETITFNIAKEEIDIKYHVADHMLICSTRHFTKPSRWWDPTVVLDWSPDLHWNFEADVFVRPLDELELFQLLLMLMDMEVNTRLQARVAEREVKTLLKSRDKELHYPVLVKHYFQADREPERRLMRLEEKAREKAARILKRSDIIRDYMQPYLDRLDLLKVTNKKQAIRIRDDMMTDLRERFRLQATYIKEKLEQMKELVEGAQQWYQTNFPYTGREDNEECRQYLLQHMFVGHILEQRLLRFKEYAPVKYQALFNRLKEDPRLESFL